MGKLQHSLRQEVIYYLVTGSGWRRRAALFFYFFSRSQLSHEYLKKSFLLLWIRRMQKFNVKSFMKTNEATGLIIEKLGQRVKYE